MASIDLVGWNHVGIRVADRARAIAFYRLLGFEEVSWHEAPRVSILRHATGLELNLIVNAAGTPDGGGNVLMDVPVKYPGITHAAFRVRSIDATIAALRAAGVTITEGPVELGGVEVAVFVRDPDGTVVELAERRD